MSAFRKSKWVRASALVFGVGLLAAALLHLFLAYFRIEPGQTLIFSEREAIDARRIAKQIRLRMDIYPGGNAGEDRIPVLLIGGGGWSMGVPQRNAINHWVDLLRDSRFRLFSMEYRSVDCGLFSALANTRPEHSCFPHPAQIEDVDAAVAFLTAHANRLGIDASKIMLLGDSSGGHTAALYALQASSRGCSGLSTCGHPVAGVLTFASPLDLHTTLIANPAFRVLASRLLGIAPDRLALAIEGGADARLVHSADPALQLHKGAPPFLLVHSRDDFFVPRSASVSFQREARQILQRPSVSCDGKEYEPVHDAPLPDSVQPASHALFFAMLSVSKYTYLEDVLPASVVDLLFQIESLFGGADAPDMSAISPAVRTSDMRRDLAAISRDLRAWMACRAEAAAP